MRTRAPHPLIRFRIALLAVALLALATAALALGLFKGSTMFPVAQVTAGGCISFVWLSWAFWWLELRYPHIPVGSDEYVSRSELARGFMHAYSGGFLVAYGIAAALATVACLNVATHA